MTTGSLGGQFLLWETATAVAGYLLGINPFDQPDVESAKKAARGLLDAQPEPEAAAFTDGVVEVRGTDGLLDGVDSLQGAVDALLGQLDEKGYLAVMAYLDSERDADLTAHPARARDQDRASGDVRLGSAVPALDRPVPQGRPPGGRVPADHHVGTSDRRGDPGSPVHLRHADLGAGRR